MVCNMSNIQKYLKTKTEYFDFTKYFDLRKMFNVNIQLFFLSTI